jgi:hypothetical protein
MMTEADERGSALVTGEEVPDRPRVVDEAHEVLTSYTWQLVVAGGLSVAAWIGSGFLGFAVSPLWLLPVLAVLALLFLVPVSREPRLARDVIRRWDQLRVERALESAGVSGDPRLEVAESMADRIVRHPSVDHRTRDATAAMLRRLRRLLRDLARVEYLAHARVTMDQSERSRSISDLQDILDARAAEVLGRIAQLHRTVVLRDTAALEDVVTGVEELVRSLEAEEEVERLLTDAERG